MLADPIKENTSKNHQVDVFSLVFVCADNKNVSARLTTDLFIKIWVGQLHAAEPKAAYSSKKILPSRFSLVFVSATPLSVSALTLLPNNCQFLENSDVLFGVGGLHVRRPNHAPTLKKGQIDVFPLVFVGDNINVSALLNTDLFTKISVGLLHAADP